MWRHFKDGDLNACDEGYEKKRGGEVKEIHGGGMKRCRRQSQERKKYRKECVRTVLRRIRGGIEA